MTSQQIQYIILFIILGAIIAWLIYSLSRKKPQGSSNCFGCSLAEHCKKKELRETKNLTTESCNDCPQTDDCDKRSDFLGCGGRFEGGKEKK